jgi:small subunit ribosomal protein S18
MPPQKQKQRTVQKKNCPFDRPGVKYIDYKDYPTLKPYIDYFGNIRAKYYTGLCLKHQKMLKTAVERARFMGFLAYRK